MKFFYSLTDAYAYSLWTSNWIELILVTHDDLSYANTCSREAFFVNSFELYEKVYRMTLIFPNKNAQLLLRCWLRLLQCF